MRGVALYEMDSLFCLVDEFSKPMIGGTDYELVSTESMVNSCLSNWFPAKFSDDLSHEF